MKRKSSITGGESFPGFKCLVHSTFVETQLLMVIFNYIDNTNV